MAGKKRIIGHHSSLGFHEFFGPGDTPGEDDQLKLALNPNYNKDELFLKDLLFERGVSREFINQAFETPYDEMFYPDENQLITENIIQEVKDHFEISELQCLYFSH